MKNQDNINAITVSFAGLEIKEVKFRRAACALAALAVVPKKAIESAMRMAKPFIDDMLANHANPKKSTAQSVVTMWSDPQSVAIILAAFSQFGFSTQDIVRRFWLYSVVTSAQRAGNKYLALKAQIKALSLASWIVSGTPLAHLAVNKYMSAQLITAEVLNVDVIRNQDVYDVYQSHGDAIARLTVDMDAELKTQLLDAQLFKSAGTSSTQRTTTANLMQMLDAGVNAGNERCIYFDRQSPLYVMLTASLFNANANAD